VLGVKAPPVRIDSQAKYGAMARGDAVIYLRFPHTGYREKIWDHAAGSIVITGVQISAMWLGLLRRIGCKCPVPVIVCIRVYISFIFRYALVAYMGFDCTPAEAGGEVFDAAGEPLDFSRGRWLDLESGIIATNKKLKPVVLSAVQKCLKELKPSAKH
jgi:3'(2'), 5'-bisphosphate nucleotidase/inositol polyphosphate 1-phosphatase